MRSVKFNDLSGLVHDPAEKIREVIFKISLKC